MKPVFSHLTKHAPMSMLLSKLGAMYIIRGSKFETSAHFILNKMCIEMVYKTFNISLPSISLLV